MRTDWRITIVAIATSATICLLRFIGCFVHDSAPQVSQLSVHFIGCFVRDALPSLSQLSFFTSLAISFMIQCIPMQQPPFGARSGWEELAGVQQPLGWTLQIPSWGVQQSSSSCKLDYKGISAREADVVPHSLHNSANKLMLLALPMTVMPMTQSCHRSRCQMEGNALPASIRTINGTLLTCSESLRFTSCVGGANPGAKRRANQ